MNLRERWIDGDIDPISFVITVMLMIAVGCAVLSFVAQAPHLDAKPVSATLKPH